ncbi:unnamed protein product [Caenorhabditis sp. 36 PRJEB53466]|nr:unnamed protein product [Caenorhabditis sp. 36 PRJEB53466]
MNTSAYQSGDHQIQYNMVPVDQYQQPEDVANNGNYAPQYVQHYPIHWDQEAQFENCTGDQTNESNKPIYEALRAKNGEIFDYLEFCRENNFSQKAVGQIVKEMEEIGMVKRGRKKRMIQIVVNAHACDQLNELRASVTRSRRLEVQLDSALAAMSRKLEMARKNTALMYLVGPHFGVEPNDVVLPRSDGVETVRIAEGWLKVKCPVGFGRPIVGERVKNGGFVRRVDSHSEVKRKVCVPRTFTRKPIAPSLPKQRELTALSSIHGSNATADLNDHRSVAEFLIGANDGTYTGSMARALQKKSELGRVRVANLIERPKAIAARKKSQKPAAVPVDQHVESVGYPYAENCQWPDEMSEPATKRVPLVSEDVRISGFESVGYPYAENNYDPPLAPVVTNERDVETDNAVSQDAEYAEAVENLENMSPRAAMEYRSKNWLSFVPPSERIDLSFLEEGLYI